MGGVNTSLILLNTMLIVIEANHLHMLRKLNRDGHPDISKTDKGEFFFSGYQTLIQCLVVHFSLFPFINKRCKG